MAFLQQNEEDLNFEYPEELELPGSSLNEVEIFNNYIERISGEVEDANMRKAILCLFAWGYYGANKLNSGKGVIVKIKGVEKNLSNILGIQKEKEGENNPLILTASKLARIGLGYAYKQSANSKHKSSPVWKKCPLWKNEDDKKYLQIHGHLIPLRFPNLTVNEKIACLAVNATMQFASSKGEYRESTMKRVSSVCRLSGIPESSVSKYIKKTIGISFIGGSIGLINSYLTGLLPKREKTKTPKKTENRKKRTAKAERIREGKRKISSDEEDLDYETEESEEEDVE